jgi:VWFA-related protein
MLNRCLRIAGLLVLVGGTALGAGQAQDPPADQTASSGPVPTFKAQVEYVEVDALVTDAQGRPVRGLSKDDFQVFEDGKRQTISSFVFVDIPVERADRPLFQPNAIEPDVSSNERPFDGRVYVMVLDDWHTAPLRTVLVKNAARQFIQRNLGANDLMAIVTTGGRTDASQEFTSNRRLLLNAVDKFMGQKLESATITRNNEYFRQRDMGNQGRVNDPDDLERGQHARSTLNSIKSVAEWFGGVRGRKKTLLLISEGIDYDITDIIRGYDAPSSSASSIIDDTREAIAAAARANVSIYAVDPRGLTTMGDETIGVSSFADDPTQGIGVGSLNNELRLSQESLRTLADETGGFAAVNTNQFRSAFERIVSDNSTYYVLAYYPPSDKRNGKFHKIEVKTTRPGLNIRSRKGYAAPRGKAPAASVAAAGKPSVALTEALNSPIQVSGVRMRMFAAPFKGAAPGKGATPKASVLVGVEMIGQDLSLAENSKVEVSYYAFDTQGKSRAGSTDSLTTNLKPETKARVQKTGFRMLNRLELAPGRYQLRVASHDSVGGTAGSLTYDLEVPDYSKTAFSMSGLVMTSMSGSTMVTVKPDNDTKDVLPAAPIATRSFPQNDEIALFAEIYDNAAATPHKVDIVTTIQSDDGRVLFKAEEERNSSELQGAKGGYGYVARVPLTEIAPGDYVLNVQAKSRLGKDVGVGRQVRVRVTPPLRVPQPQ